MTTVGAFGTPAAQWRGTNRSSKEAEIRRRCEERGIHIVETAPSVYRVLAPGIDLMCTDLLFLHPSDLDPVDPIESGRARNRLLYAHKAARTLRLS